MDPARHFYDPSQFGMGKDNKLRLNQDGARNLLGLYQCMGGEPMMEEIWDVNGHLLVNCRLPIISQRNGAVVAWGLGTCSTKETKYAYRWVGQKYVPDHYDKRSLKTRAGQYGDLYRIDNDDLADQYHTVRHMARKRAEVNGVLELPCVTEIFAPEVADDEKGGPQDDGYQIAIDNIFAWYNSIAGRDRKIALQKMFGLAEPRQLRNADLETVEHWLATIQEYQDAGINWKSPRLIAELEQLIGKRGEQAKEDLFGKKGE